MSVPVAPKKPSYTPLRDGRNSTKNNNEGVLSLGDPNANPIMLGVSCSQEEPETRQGLAEETGSANSNEQERRAQFQKELLQLQGFGQGPQAGSAGRRDLYLPPTLQQELSDVHVQGSSPDLLQVPCSVRGPSLSSWRGLMGEMGPEGLAKRDAEIARPVPKDKLAKTLDNEELRRHCLGRASGSGSLTLQHAHSARLPVPEARAPVSEGREGLQGILMDPCPRAASPPAAGTSEGKSVHSPKPSTSEAKEPASSDTQKEGTQVLNVCNEHTLRSAHLEPTLHSTSAAKETLSKSEAQLGQGNGEPKPELKSTHTRAGQELKVSQTGGLGCDKDLKGPCREAQKEATGGAGGLSSSSPHHVGVGGGSGEEKTEATLNEEGSLYTNPASLEATESQHTGKISPDAGGTLGERVSSNSAPGDGHVGFIPNDHMDRQFLGISEKRRLASGNKASAVVLASDSFLGASTPAGLERLDPQNGHLEAGESKGITPAMAESGNLLENAARAEIPPVGADSIPNMPAPPHPEITVNVTHQPPPPSSSVQELGVFRVDTGSPSAAPPATDRAGLLDTSPKVPDKDTCPRGIPKPVLTQSKDAASLQEGVENHQVDKTEERTETKPLIMPKPKHVRPKIITYIRRNPQALGQVDTSLVPMGLPYAPPTCSVPLPQEEKAASGDLKPSANLYEKFKPDLQKPRVFSSGLMVSGIKPPGHHFSQMGEKFLQEVTDHPGKEEFCSPSYSHYEVPPTFYRSAVLLKPQLGLGAMSRLPSAKSRILIASQRSSASAIHPPGPIAAAASLYSTDPSGFFAHKVEHESRNQNGRSFQRTGTLAFERVYTANQNCVDAYPTFLAVLWTAGLLCSQVPAAFAGLMYLFVRQKYFVGYLGERTQSTPGYIFGKRIILFLFLMSLAGILNYCLILLFGSDFENYIKTISTTISPLLLIP